MERGMSKRVLSWKGTILFFALPLLFSLSAAAHVGSPNVFFEGKAGPYPVHVVIQPAEVIPGLAGSAARICAAISGTLCENQPPSRASFKPSGDTHQS